MGEGERSQTENNRETERKRQRDKRQRHRGMKKECREPDPEGDHRNHCHNGAEREEPGEHIHIAFLNCVKTYLSGA